MTYHGFAIFVLRGVRSRPLRRGLNFEVSLVVALFPGDAEFWRGLFITFSARRGEGVEGERGREEEFLWGRRIIWGGWEVLSWN